MLPHDRLRGDQNERVLNEPFVICAGLVVPKLKGVRDKLNMFGARNGTKRLHPDFQAMRLLLHEHHLVLVVPQAGEVAIVRPIEELAALVGAVAGKKSRWS